MPKPNATPLAERIKNARRIFTAGMPRTLGIRIVAITPKKITGEMRVKPMHLNNKRRVNGGALMAFADVLGAAGAVVNRPSGFRGGTLESKTNFFAAATGPVLKGVSVPLHIGRTTSVWQTSIKNSSDGRTVAIVTQTQMALPIGGAGAGEEE